MNGGRRGMGTGNRVGLRHMSQGAAQGVPAGRSPSIVPVTRPASQTPASPPLAAIQPQAANPVMPGNTSFSFDPGQITAVKNHTFVLKPVVSGGQKRDSVPGQINSDAAEMPLGHVSQCRIPLPAW